MFPEYPEPFLSKIIVPEIVMKYIKLSVLPMLLIVVGIFINPTWGAELTIYTYDSFNSEWGPGPVVFKRFEKQCACKLKVVSPGDRNCAQSCDFGKSKSESRYSAGLE